MNLKTLLLGFWSTLFFVCANIAHAQQSTFTMQVANSDVISACVGIGVTFTNTSSLPVSNVKWDFGDNYTASKVGSIAHSYEKGGTYTINLINAATLAIVGTRTITIYNNPTATFSMSDSVTCVGNKITFSSTSIPGSGTINTYSWSMGDGNVLTLPSPSVQYTYNQGGVFIPILTVQDNNGCVGNSPSNKQIKVNGNQLQSSFLANGNDFFSCTNNITLENTTNEAGQKGITYLWNFGDNTSSTEKSPQAHAYNEPGIYTITLQSSFLGMQGCTPTFSKTVYIGKPTITVDAPDNICQNTSIPLAVHSNIDGLIRSNQDVTWTVSSATITGNGANATFNTAGLASLTVINKNGCKTSVTKKIDVAPLPKIALTIDPPTGLCIGTKTNAEANITNGVAIAQYIWAPEGTNGSVHDTTTSNSYSYQFKNAGAYSYQVTAKGTNGCSATQTQPLSIAEECIDNGFGSAYNPIFSFQSESCTNKYKIVIKNKIPSKPVDYWTVNGTKYTSADGQTGTITLPTTKGAVYAVNTYYKDGSHDLNRKITIIDETAAFDIANNDNATLYCANNNFSFTTNKYINKDNIAKFDWKITDSKGNTVKTNTTSQWNYAFLNPDDYTIQLTITDITNNACVSPTSQTISVHGFSGDFSTSNSKTTFCTPSETVTFNSAIVVGSSPLAKEVWNFGDKTDSTILTPTPSFSIQHTYFDTTANLRSFTVSLKATDEMGCSVTINKSNYIRLYQPKIGLSTADTLLCSKRTVTLNNLSDANNAKYTWTLGSKTVQSNSKTVDIPLTSVAVPSQYTLSLHLVDAGGCEKDTTIDNYIKFRKPVAQYTIPNMEAFQGCPPFTLTVKNASTDYDSVHWSINDNFNSIQKDSFYYTVLHPGPVDFTLDATLDGCISTNKDNYTVKGPVAKLLTKDTVGCTPYTSLLYVSDNTDIVSYQWDKGDNQTYITDTTSDSVRFTYEKEGTYYPSITFVGTDGCSDKQQYPSPIIVEQSIHLQYTKDYSFCSNDTMLYLKVTADYATEYSWSQSPTTGYMSSTSGTTIAVKPTENTTYHILAKSNNTCPDESGDITVKAVAASIVTMTPNTIAEPAGSLFTFAPNLNITNEDAGVQYYWSPDYRINNRFLKNPTVIADVDTTYYISVKNENGCVSFDSVHVKVLCNTSKLLMANAFTPNGDGKNDRFFVTGYGIKNVVHFIIIDRWGNKIFERNNIAANDINQGWDGNINSRPAMPGTYMYIAEVECTEGNIIPLKGSVVLIR